MCAIAGVIDFNGINEKQKNWCVEAQKLLQNRGPDQDGIFQSDFSALVHTRLAVIDIEKGRQPMIFQRGREKFVLVYNGELYNTEDIRKELALEGYTFEGHSDTEVVLKSYVCWGEKCVDKFNGIFAFAVWEEHNKRLFIARDRIGVKPFFYTVKNHAFYFSSEIKGLLCNPEIPCEIDKEGINEIMLIGPARTMGCGILKGIEELPMGWCGCWDKENGLRKWQYWDFACEHKPQTFDETAEQVRYLVTDAIKRQIVSDVPLCTFLSGGLDSSLISSVTSQEFKKQGKQLHTFSVEYRDNQKYFKASKFQPNSDDYYIEQMAKYLDSVHHHIVIDTPELVQALYSAVDARDLPGMADVDSSLLLFCKEVKNFATVALSGECADEIFGGYPWYRDKDIRMTDGFPWSQSTAYRKSLMKEDFADDKSEQYVYDKYKSTISKVKDNSSLSPLEKRMREMMRLNMEWFMQVLLDRKDRMSMYSGLEVRVPFCDYRIVEYLYQVPWEYKDYKGREKGLLRESMKDYLPEEVLWRKKSPYPKTHNPSYENAVKAELTDVINDSSSPVLQILKKDKLQELVNGRENVQWYGQLMNNPQIMAYILQFNYWLKKFNVKIL